MFSDVRYRPDPKQRRQRPVFRDLVPKEENAGHIHASSRQPGTKGGLDQGPGADPVGAGGTQQGYRNKYAHEHMEKMIFYRILYLLTFKLQQCHQIILKMTSIHGFNMCLPEVRMQERVFMGIGNKPFMDIQPSDAAISDRAVNCVLIGRGTAG